MDGIVSTPGFWLGDYDAEITRASGTDMGKISGSHRSTVTLETKRLNSARAASIQGLPSDSSMRK